MKSPTFLVLPLIAVVLLVAAPAFVGCGDLSGGAGGTGTGTTAFATSPTPVSSSTGSTTTAVNVGLEEYKTEMTDWVASVATLTNFSALVADPTCPTQSEIDAVREYAAGITERLEALEAIQPPAGLAEVHAEITMAVRGLAALLAQYLDSSAENVDLDRFVQWALRESEVEQPMVMVHLKELIQAYEEAKSSKGEVREELAALIEWMQDLERMQEDLLATLTPTNEALSDGSAELTVTPITGVITNTSTELTVTPITGVVTPPTTAPQ
jgi:hypothetical protein